MARISITIQGTKETSDTLKKIAKEIQNPIEPLDLSSKKYLSYISTNFEDEGKTFGKPWAPLRPATIEIKRGLKAKGKAIEVEKPLVRTGLMRRSFGYSMKGSKDSSIYNKTDYALVHQEGGTVFYKGQPRKVPKRTLAEVDDTRIKMVSMTFESWIYRLIKKYKAG